MHFSARARPQNLRTPEPPQGFTIVEVTVTLGIFAAIICLYAGFGTRELRDDAFRADRDALVSLLRSARSDALNDLHGLPHGVALHPPDHPDAYVAFEGASYDQSESSSREVLAADANTEIDVHAPKEILFCPLSGTAVTAIASGTGCDDPRNYFDGELAILSETGRFASTVTINHEGALSW